MAKSPLSVKRPSTLSAYKPSLREQAAILGEKGFKALTGREPGYEARENINRYTGLLDLLDVPGAVLSADEAARNIKSKQYGAAAGDIAGLAAGAIPIAGGALKKGAKKVVEEGVEGAGRLVEKYISSSSGEPLTVYHGSRTGATGDFKPFTHDETNLPGVTFSTEKNVANRYANDFYNRAEYGDKITPALTTARIRGTKLPTIEDFYNQVEDYYKKDFNKITPQERLDFAKSKGITALNTEAIGEKGEVFVLDPSAIETTPFEDLTTKYNLPPVITGAEREANLARFMEGSEAPRDLYHGTGADIEEPKGIFWGSDNPSLANEYAAMRQVMGGNANVVPVHMNVGSVFDADNLPKDVTINHFFNEALQQAQNSGKNVDVEKAKSLLKTIRENAKIEESGPHYSRHEFWNHPEDSFGKQGAAAIRDMMDTLGFDSIKMLENSTKTYGVFDPKRIKSKYNIGTFDPTIPHIGKAHGGPVSLSDKYGY